ETAEDDVDKHQVVIETLKRAQESISVDLVQTARNELDFLRYFESQPWLFEDDVLRNAVRRYEQCWLPMKPDVDVLPPNDVFLVWHAHMLRPHSYHEDSLAIAGEVLDHAYQRDEEMLLVEEPEEWRLHCPYEPYHLSGPEEVPKVAYKSRSDYDIVAAVKRQSFFAKKVKFT
ncbi:Protein F32B5.7, partial [Aphelenchoides avenae]